MGGEGKLYHDVDVVERTDITPVGKAVKVYNVSAYTKGDTYFTIRVTEADFSKEKVDKSFSCADYVVKHPRCNIGSNGDCEFVGCCAGFYPGKLVSSAI
ncbi:unnamed protein product [marine sediment metagenome]|uniref:Uncharacterized protein n=1 Tax=marine sediment metagenome TaxID=412755 RepID=X1NDI2_9ZZZZ